MFVRSSRGSFILSFDSFTRGVNRRSYPISSMSCQLGLVPCPPDSLPIILDSFATVCSASPLDISEASPTGQGQNWFFLKNVYLQICYARSFFHFNWLSQHPSTSWIQDIIHWKSYWKIEQNQSTSFFSTATILTLLLSVTKITAVVSLLVFEFLL